MVIAVFPLEPDRFRHHVLANFVVNVSFVGLTELVAAAHTVHLAVLDEMCARLVETERDILCHALLSEGKHPIVIARPRVDARLASYRYLLYRLVQIRRQVYSCQQRRSDDGLVADRQRAENRHAVVDHRLILHRAAHNNVGVAVAPIVGHTLHEAVDALGEEEKTEVAPKPHHLPAFGAPRVGVLEQEVGGEACEDYFAALYLPRFVALMFNRQIEIARLAAQAACNLAAIHLVLPVDIAVLAPRAYLGTPVPWVPVGVYFPMLGHDYIAKIVF